MRRFRLQNAGASVLDQTDRLILARLRQNAREPIVSLARAIGLSRTATQGRLAKLERIGAIAGYTVVEPSPLAGRAAAYLHLRLEPGRQCEQVVPHLLGVAGLAGIDAVSGPIDLVVLVEADSVEGIEGARAAMELAPGVAEVTTHIVMKRHLARSGAARGRPRSD